MIQKLPRVFIGVLLAVVLAIGLSAPAYAQEELSKTTIQILKPQSYLYRVNSSSIKGKATPFYVDILGMTIDQNMDTPCTDDPKQICWREFYYPNVVQGRIAVYQNPYEGTGTAKGVITIVVDNVAVTKKYLEDRAIPVSSIQKPGNGVRLAFFTDRDGNSLAIRDNKGTN
ncbi:VOC family protein [Gloeothece verrucosa]|uniref:VOC domain-containing protein n=1 Tax=Gloeothece verrucosa (strain PCC 7822) TaxID=497965 RepID=E0UE73_GLOV7|nr:VOC family protein [Gloeothece verrucosa]ADN14198.1 hypothetical protein Cyan7822_2219 [Gloeothece verrucosa PCC 7822]